MASMQLAVNNSSSNMNVLATAAAQKVSAVKKVDTAKYAEEKEQDEQLLLEKIPSESLAKMKFYKPRAMEVPASAEATSDAVAKPSNVPLNVAMNAGMAPLSKGQSEDALKKGAANGIEKSESAAKPEPYTGCKTCQERVYKDGSDDAGVSFQGAKHISAATAAVAVTSHEGEHVSRESAKAQKEGKVITHKTVTLQMACCPECKQMYVAGGETVITTMPDMQDAPDIEVMSALDIMGERGEAVDEGL